MPIRNDLCRGRGDDFGGPGRGFGRGRWGDDAPFQGRGRGFNEQVKQLQVSTAEQCE